MNDKQEGSPPVQRAAFKMRLKPGFEAEYRRRHAEIWPELAKLLGEAGISDYSIFLDEETLTLFAVHKITGDNTAADLSSHPVVRKWWDHLADIMDTHPDHSPVCIPLTEVFHLD